MFMKDEGYITRLSGITAGTTFIYVIYMVLTYRRYDSHQPVVQLYE